MQTDPTACHSPIGLFQGVSYLVDLAIDGRVAPARGTRLPALDPDRRRVRWRGQTEVAVHPSWVGGFPKALGQSSLTNLAPRGVGRGTRRPAWAAPYDRATGLAAQAGSSPTGARPSAPSRWPNGWAASTPPPIWARPGYRCARLSPATAWACPPNPEAVRQRAIAAARQLSGRPPRPWARCLRRSILAPSPPTVSGRAVPVGPPRGAVRHLGHQRGGRAVQRESRPPTTTGPGRSSDEPTAATGWPTNAPAAPTAATPTEPTAPAAPTNPRSGRWWPMSTEPTGPTSEQRAAPHSLSTLMSLAHDPSATRL
jgi:hypothetical protein